MAVSQIKMPQLGESVTEGTVDKWLKHEGDFVKRDEPLVEVVTDKVNAEIPSPFEGKLVKIAVSEGETVRVGAVIAQIETGAAAAGAATQPKPKEASVAQTEAPPEPAGGNAPARAAAAPAEVADGGDRVTRDDVLAAVGGQQAAATAQAPPAPAHPAAPAAAPPARADGAREELVKLSVMRKSIAEHMVRSLATSPHAWTLQEIDMTSLVRYRETEKDNFKARHGVALTYLPFVAQILCEALKQFSWLNSTWTDEGVILKRYVNLGIAVSIPDGLIVPVSGRATSS